MPLTLTNLLDRSNLKTKKKKNNQRSSGNHGVQLSSMEVTFSSSTSRSRWVPNSPKQAENTLPWQYSFTLTRLPAINKQIPRSLQLSPTNGKTLGHDQTVLHWHTSSYQQADPKESSALPNKWKNTLPWPYSFTLTWLPAYLQIPVSDEPVYLWTVEIGRNTLRIHFINLITACSQVTHRQCGYARLDADFITVILGLQQG